MTHQTPAEIREQLLHALDFAYCQGIGFSTPEELLAAYDASRTTAAVSAAVAPPTNQTALRDRIAQALAREDAHNAGYDHGFVGSYGADDETDGFVDAVLAVLPPTTDRAAVLREAADAVAAHPGPIPWLPGLPKGEGDGFWWDTRDRDAVVALLRRMADETATETPEWARPETEEEKLAKCRRMAKALSAPPVAPPEWATTTEWPGRHKRPGDRRVHATARFIVNDKQRFWTACGEDVGRGGTPMGHMPVDCRGCKRATAAGVRQDGAQP